MSRKIALKQVSKKGNGMKIERVLILGSGTMGRQIAWAVAKGGYQTVVHDLSDELLGAAQAGIVALAAGTVASGAMTEADRDAALERIVYEASLEIAAKGVDLVSESVPEDPVLKGEILGRVHARCPAHTIFTTNSSTLLPSMFANASGRPEKLAALHFHVPELDRIVDVMPHAATSPKTLDAVREFAESIGMIVIELKQESPGYVFNAMLAALVTAALALATRNIAEPEVIDRAWMGVMQCPIGPFGLMDQVGLETTWKIAQYWAKETGDPQSLENAAYLERFVRAGELGVKTGRGFYSYPDADWMQPTFVEKGA